MTEHTFFHPADLNVVHLRWSPCGLHSRTGFAFLPPALQYYFNALLHLKDEMSQLGEPLQPPAP